MSTGHAIQFRDAPLPFAAAPFKYKVPFKYKEYYITVSFQGAFSY